MNEKFVDITDKFLEEIHWLIKVISAKTDMSSREQMEQLVRFILTMLDGTNGCFYYDMEDILLDIQSKSGMFFLTGRFEEIRE